MKQITYPIILFFLLVCFGCKTGTDKTGFSKVKEIDSSGFERPLVYQVRVGGSMKEWLNARGYVATKNCLRMMEYQNNERQLFIDGESCISKPALKIKIGYIVANDAKQTVNLMIGNKIVGEAVGVMNYEARFEITKLCSEEFSQNCSLVFQNGGISGININEGSADINQTEGTAADDIILFNRVYNTKFTPEMETWLSSQGYDPTNNCLQTRIEDLTIYAYLSGKSCFAEPTIKLRTEFDLEDGRTALRNAEGKRVGEVSSQTDYYFLDRLCVGKYNDVCKLEIKDGRIQSW